MRLLEETLVLLSEDLGSSPKKVRFKEEFSDSELELIAEVITRQESFPIGTHNIALNNIAQGRFLLVKPTNDAQISINGGAALTVRGGKVSKLWVEFTSLSLIVSNAANTIVVVVAGE